MRHLWLALAVAAAGASAAPIPDRLAVRPSCEPYTDPRELRFRVPAASITGRVAPGSIAEPDNAPPEAGQQLVFGTAELIADGDGTKSRIAYSYWNTTDGCGGWEPARGGRFTFDLADDKSADGELRVMRYSVVR